METLAFLAQKSNPWSGKKTGEREGIHNLKVERFWARMRTLPVAGPWLLQGPSKPYVSVDKVPGGHLKEADMGPGKTCPPLTWSLQAGSALSTTSCFQRRPTCPCWHLSVSLSPSPFYLVNKSSSPQLLTSKTLVCLGFRKGVKGQFTQIKDPVPLRSELWVQGQVSKWPSGCPQSESQRFKRTQVSGIGCDHWIQYPGYIQDAASPCPRMHNVPEQQARRT